MTSTRARSSFISDGVHVNQLAGFYARSARGVRQIDRGSLVQRLSGLDSLFVSLESPTNLFHVGAVAVLDPTTAPPGSPPPHEALRQVLEERLHLLAPFRRRLVTVPGGVDHPRWVEDEPVKLERHLLRGAVCAPGDDAEVARYAAEVMSRPLDRSRPLWELHVVEGLEGGLVAGVAKIHHSAVDGIAGAEVTGLLMDLTPEVMHFAPPQAERVDERARSLPNPVSLLLGALPSAGRRAVPAARMLARLAMASWRIQSRNREPDTLTPPSPFSGPRTSLSGKVGTRRAVGLSGIDREEVSKVREVTGATVNDVVLAVTGAALRAHLEEAGDLPDEPLAAFVPVSVRSERDTPESGVNRLSGMLVSLATSVADPVVRLMAISECARNAKEQDRILGPEVFCGLADLAVPAVLRPAGRLARATGLTTRRPPFSVVVSSFPGPPCSLYCAGAELVAYYPFGPIIDGSALNVTAMSYKDRIGFGLLACADSVKGVDVLAHRIPEAMRELTKAVRTHKSGAKNSPDKSAAGTRTTSPVRSAAKSPAARSPKGR